MKRAILGFFLLAPLAGSLGCAMCCAPGDYNYPTYGGKWQRVAPTHGRVGSVYSPEAWAELETVIPPEAEEEADDNVYYSR